MVQMRNNMENSLEQQPQKQQPEIKPKASWGRRTLGFFVLLVVVGTSLFVFKTARTFGVITIGGFSHTELFLQEEMKLYKDPDRINILLLGIRGENDPHGGLLADMILLASIRKDDGRVALISIPRDLYVDIPGHNKKERINFAYAKGEELGSGGGGVLLSKRVVSDVTGVYIDHAVSVDFFAFKEVVETLGGIDVYVPRDFRESTQWTYEFFVPKGWNHMDAETALYYVRSRYSTSDFDRARRQQDMLLAIKSRVLSLGVLANPAKIFSFLDIIGRHVRTDLDADAIKELMKIASKKEVEVVTRKVLDTSEGGFLYSTSVDGAYVLLPKEGNFDAIQDFAINVFEER